MRRLREGAIVAGDTVMTVGGRVGWKVGTRVGALVGTWVGTTVTCDADRRSFCHQIKNRMIIDKHIVKREGVRGCQGLGAHLWGRP